MGRSISSANCYFTILENKNKQNLLALWYFAYLVRTWKLRTRNSRKGIGKSKSTWVDVVWIWIVSSFRHSSRLSRHLEILSLLPEIYLRLLEPLQIPKHIQTFRTITLSELERSESLFLVPNSKRPWCPEGRNEFLEWLCSWFRLFSFSEMGFLSSEVNLLRGGFKSLRWVLHRLEYCPTSLVWVHEDLLVKLLSILEELLGEPEVVQWSWEESMGESWLLI